LLALDMDRETGIRMRLQLFALSNSLTTSNIIDYSHCYVTLCGLHERDVFMSPLKAHSAQVSTVLANTKRIAVCYASLMTGGGFMVFSRPKKLDHVDTLRYEIEMLRFTVGKLSEQKLTGRDAWVYLESFLLHYRNLVEFLGNDNPRQTDLHVTNIWQLAGLSAPVNLNEIHAKARALWERYEPSDKKGGGRISQYLQHCTMKRVDAKDWRVSAMFNEIEPLLVEVEEHLGPRKGILVSVSAVGPLDYFAASTTVVTSTAVAAVGFEPSLKKQLKS
jgi:hypothetical protein